MRNSIPQGDVLSFVPDYNGPKALPSAKIEGAWVVSALGAQPMEATRSAFLGVLDGNSAGPVSLLHFAGHGCVDTGVMDGGIEFEDEIVNVQEVDNSSIVLGRRDGTLLVLNACETASAGKLLGMNTGWGAAIAAREFGGLIAPLWEVQDAVALLMVQATLPPLLDGRSTLGEALQQARNIHGDSSIAAFAYLAHGDVMARFTTS
ncbi:MAG: CHAT domain-containing protein [Sphingobium sp.]|nr:CHAT domain-containing protein [Sphingobium sp.]